MMSLQQRKQFNLVECTLFAVLFAIFGGLGLMLYASDVGLFENLPPIIGAVLSVFLYGLLAGWGFTGLVGGVWLGCRFVSSCGKRLIILACVFFMFTFQIFWLVGMVVTIPFVIYNFTKIRRGEDETEISPAVQIHFSRNVRIIVAAALFALAAFLVIGMVNEHTADQFFPSPQEAFTNHHDTTGELGEIIFTNEHENNLTLFTVRDGHFLGTNYVTEIRNGEKFYRLWEISRGISIHDRTIAQFLLHTVLTDNGFTGRANRNRRQEFGRIPIFGTYRHEVIRHLSINGIPVEHVIEFTNEHGERYFAWYFSDLPPFSGMREEIEIRFGGGDK